MFCVTWAISLPWPPQLQYVAVTDLHWHTQCTIKSKMQYLRLMIKWDCEWGRGAGFSRPGLYPTPYCCNSPLCPPSAVRTFLSAASLCRVSLITGVLHACKLNFRCEKDGVRGAPSTHFRMVGLSAETNVILQSSSGRSETSVRSNILWYKWRHWHLPAVRGG